MGITDAVSFEKTGMDCGRAGSRWAERAALEVFEQQIAEYKNREKNGPAPGSEEMITATLSGGNQATKRREAPMRPPTFRLSL